ncbi:MAG: homocysteine S-methyltransferase family protein [Adlercreutzia equolifaciens]
METMADLLEAKAAVLAAVESTTLPVFATMTFGEDGRTFLGTTPAIAATTLSALGASAVGPNCRSGRRSWRRSWGSSRRTTAPRHGATQRGLAPHSGWRDRLRRGP